MELSHHSSPFLFVSPFSFLSRDQLSIWATLKCQSDSNRSLLLADLPCTTLYGPLYDLLAILLEMAENLSIQSQLALSYSHSTIYLIPSLPPFLLCFCWSRIDAWLMMVTANALLSWLATSLPNWHSALRIRRRKER